MFHHDLNVKFHELLFSTTLLHQILCKCHYQDQKEEEEAVEAESVVAVAEEVMEEQAVVSVLVERRTSFAEQSRNQEEAEVRRRL
jgi:hypothetical protein